MLDQKLVDLVQKAALDLERNNTSQQEVMKKAVAYPPTPRATEQYEEFNAVLQELLELHLKKTSDYSSWNIRGAGEQGVAVRLWDKTARLMNLMGWDIGTGKWLQPKEPKNESVDDTLMDLASYAIIMIILRRGKWGK